MTIKTLGLWAGIIGLLSLGSASVSAKDERHSKRHIGSTASSSHHSHSKHRRDAHRSHHRAKDYDRRHGIQHYHDRKHAKRHVKRIGHATPRYHRYHRARPIHHHSRHCGHYVNGYFSPVLTSISAGVNLGNVSASFHTGNYGYYGEHRRARRADYYLDSYGVCYSIQTRRHRRVYVEVPVDYCY